MSQRNVLGGLSQFPSSYPVQTLTLGFEEIPLIPEGSSGDGEGFRITLDIGSLTPVRVSAYISGGRDEGGSAIFPAYINWPAIRLTQNHVVLTDLPETFDPGSPEGQQQPYRGWIVVEGINAGGQDIASILFLNPFGVP